MSKASSTSIVICVESNQRKHFYRVQADKVPAKELLCRGRCRAEDNVGYSVKGEENFSTVSRVRRIRVLCIGAQRSRGTSMIQ